MLKRTHLAAIGAAVLLTAGAAAAQGQPTYDGWSFVGGEAGWTLAPQATTPVPDARIAVQPVQPDGDVSADGRKFVGGEAGWNLEAHRYEFRGGKLAMVHEPWCVASHDLPVPSKSPFPDQERQWNLYQGA